MTALVTQSLSLDLRVGEPASCTVVAAVVPVLLAIDPGTTESAWVLWDGRRVLGHAKEPNEHVLGRLDARSFNGVRPDRMVCEMVASYGMAVGRTVFETVLWIGRFVQAWYPDADGDLPWRLVYRRDVKLHLCGNARAKDGNIRQALLDRFGGKEAAVGRKANQGPLFGISGDRWSALAVAITASETP